jgi:hypothetical protein
LIDEHGKIIGTKLMFKTKLVFLNVLEMKNIGLSKFSYKGDLVSSTFK